jgi:hypothetical protein
VLDAHTHRRIPYARTALAISIAIIVLIAAGPVPVSSATAATPTISVSPGSGSPYGDFTISGSGFATRATVYVYWDGARFDVDGTDRSGSFSDLQTIPKASTGTHTVKVIVAGVSASTTFSIVNGTETSPPPAATHTPLPAATQTPLPAATQTPLPAATQTRPPTSSPTASPTGTTVPLATATRPPATPIPTATSTSTGLWIPAIDTPWQWMIDHAIDVNNAKDMGLTDPSGKMLTSAVPVMYDIDGFYNGHDPNCNIVDKNGACVSGDNDAVNQLHAMGKRVVCYIDTGVYESYRPDAYKFPTSVIGSADSGWNGSNWLDVRRTDILFPIMDSRIKMCKDKGYDSIEPDEMVNYSNPSGFLLTYQDQLVYNRGIAQIAHKYGISIALKDDPEQAADLVGDFDWMLNEQCYQYSECSLLDPFSKAGKAVFDVEYKVATTTFCTNAISKRYNAMQMPLNLDGGRWPCS